MIVSSKVSALWLDVPANILDRLGESLGRHREVTVFFRADDVAIPSAKQDLLLELFVRHDAPLCPAIVPAWLNQARWASICRRVDGKHHLFAWHQHGWNHQNHEPSGKKQEFGQGAEYAQKRRNILRGRDKLAAILGEHLQPVFTPPWNRLDLETMLILKQLGFTAMSRYRDAKIPAIPGLPDLAANVDLHTRKESSAEACWNGLFTELDQALATGRVGFMIHHQRMNTAAFAFLDGLLSLLVKTPGISLCHYFEMLNDKVATPREKT